jgi:hypothetical protein
MKKVLLAIALLLTVPGMSAAAGSMREGLWEISSKMEMPGMPMKMPPTVVKHCFTKADVADRSKVIATEKDCKVTEMKPIGNKITWAMKCTGKNAGTMNGETVFGTDSYTTVMHMNAQGHSMTMKAKAKRIGDCK